MRLIPEFHWGVLNGWLLLVAYFLGLAITAASFSKERRSKLFYKPTPQGSGVPRLTFTVRRLSAILFVLSMLLCPLQVGAPMFLVGFVVYLLGYAAVVLALLDFRGAPVERPVTDGLYRWSRNPQWIGLVLVYLGTAMAVASWLHVVLLLILVVAYHFQILTEEEACLRLYGEEYKKYMNQVPRYVLFR